MKRIINFVPTTKKKKRRKKKPNGVFEAKIAEFLDLSIV
jgi:hypothetical protein